MTGVSVQCGITDAADHPASGVPGNGGIDQLPDPHTYVSGPPARDRGMRQFPGDEEGLVFQLLTVAEYDSAPGSCRCCQWRLPAG